MERGNLPGFHGIRRPPSAYELLQRSLVLSHLIRLPRVIVMRYQLSITLRLHERNNLPYLLEKREAITSTIDTPRIVHTR